MKQYDWILWILGISSLVLFVLSLMLAPAVLIRIPPDYFTYEQRPPSRWTGRHPALRVLILIGRNTAAFILLLAGLVMLIAPGQGLLTILVALLVADFPKKYALEKRLVSQRHILRSINWIRRRRQKQSLVVRPTNDPSRSGPGAGGGTESAGAL